MSAEELQNQHINVAKMTDLIKRDRVPIPPTIEVNYSNHQCSRLIKGASMYIYAHGKDNTIDVYNPNDFEHVEVL